MYVSIFMFGSIYIYMYGFRVSVIYILGALVEGASGFTASGFKDFRPLLACVSWVTSFLRPGIQLMIEILHGFRYQNPWNYGISVYFGVFGLMQN